MRSPTWRAICVPKSATAAASTPPATPWGNCRTASRSAKDPMQAASRTHLVLIPSYNPGERVYETVRDARRSWNPVWIVVDASTDGTAEGLFALAADDPGLRVLALPRNRGKGAAVLHGIEVAHAAGFTHVLTMDSDGQD